MTSARVAAARVLTALERRPTTLGAELERARPGLPSRAERALLVELSAGTLRWRAALDAVIAHAAGRSVQRLQVEVRTVLRLGAYQLIYLPDIPDRAVVHEAVETVRAVGATRAAGLVNAALRAIGRLDPASVLPPRPPNGPRPAQLAYLSTTLSHPEWLCERWLDRYGFEATERWCLFNNTPPPVSVRPSRGLSAPALLAALREAGIEASPSPFVADGIRLAPGALGRVPAELRAEMMVQAEGAQLVARAAAVAPGESVLDACAAPGGKTLVLARDLDVDATPESRLVAGDFRRARVELLQKTLRSAGLRVPVVAHDATRPLPFKPVFDCVVLDAPCSGLGTLSRDPDLKWTRRLDQLPELAEVEGTMLDEAARVVSANGRVLYATCSSEPEENDEVVGSFLAGTPAFALESLATVTPVARFVDSRGFFVTRPDRDGLDAFFAALLVRRAAA